MKKNYKNCQSCGMPIKKDEVKGTEKDGSKSTQYCSFCYKNGEFVEPNISAEQMEEKVFSHLRNEMHFPK